jgi:hypothetical protein
MQQRPSLKPGWKIVREGRHFALLWQSRQAKLGRYKVMAVGSLREVVAAYHDLTPIRPPMSRGQTDASHGGWVTVRETNGEPSWPSVYG